MATINLLTIHWGNSYGAVLQAYATCLILERMGHDVTVINLVHPKAKRNYHTVRDFAKFITDRSFDTFRKRHFSRMTKAMSFIDSRQIPDADFAIVGSDQVWNHDITTSLGLNYFLDFVPEHIKRIALASSFGKATWSEPSNYTERVRSELRKFNGIAVREESGVKICKDVFNVDAIQVIDPTLAISDYSNLVKCRRPKNEIFAFLFRFTQEEKEIVEYVSDTLDAPVSHSSFLRVYLENNPINWLKSIQNARFIVTSSFHGVAFSILFKKQFIALCADNQKFTRISSLLESLGLSDRYIRSIQSLKASPSILTKTIDYDLVEKKLELQRNIFTDFLNRELL